jgi:hypothetical protein
MAQTYCVFDKTNFTTGNFNSDMQNSYNYNYDTSSLIPANNGIMNSSGTTIYRGSVVTTKECEGHNDCSITTYCNNNNKCELLGACQEGDPSPAEGIIYCTNDNKWINISCITDDDCSNSQKCINYKCK